MAENKQKYKDGSLQPLTRKLIIQGMPYLEFAFKKMRIYKTIRKLNADCIF